MIIRDPINYIIRHHRDILSRSNDARLDVRLSDTDTAHIMCRRVLQFGIKISIDCRMAGIKNYVFWFMFVFGPHITLSTEIRYFENVS